MADNKGRRMAGAVIVLVGALLLISAAFTPWYMEKFSEAGGTITANAYPGVPSSNGTIKYTCSGTPTCPSQTSYTADHDSHTGNIAEAGYFMAIVGFVLGLLGAVLGLMSRKDSRRVKPAVALAVVAMILAIAAVGLFAAALPGAIGADSPGHTGTGPWSSFSGSTSGLSWGPAIGWYLAIGAFVVFLIGLLILLRFRSDPEPAPMTAPASTAPAASPPAM